MTSVSSVSIIAERERDRVLAHEPINWLKKVGFGALRTPRDKGG